MPRPGSEGGRRSSSRRGRRVHRGRSFRSCIARVGRARASGRNADRTVRSLRSAGNRSMSIGKQFVSLGIRADGRAGRDERPAASLYLPATRPCVLDLMPSNGRILIVEDDPSVRDMLAEYLGTHGYEVVRVDRGTAMREAVEASLPDVVLLDVNLPGEDGLRPGPLPARAIRRRHHHGHRRDRRRRSRRRARSRR